MSLPSNATEAERRLVRAGRMWSIGGGVWATLYLTLYLVLTVSQSGQLAWWYVGNLVLAIAMIGWSVVVPFSRTLVLIAAILLGVAMIIGLVSIGILLGPAVILTAYSTRRAFHPLNTGWQDR